MIKSRNVLRSIADDIRQHFGLCFIHVFSKSQVQNNSENIYVKGREHMKYADRYGNRWEETGLQDRFLEKLYKSAGTSVGFQNGWLDIEPESILLADPVILKRTSDG